MVAVIAADIVPNKGSNFLKVRSHALLSEGARLIQSILASMGIT
jgi:hypothetical protein